MKAREFFVWGTLRPHIEEFFNFWENEEDRVWAALMWPALIKARLLSENDNGLPWARKNICALALIYNESVCRFGVDPHKFMRIEKQDLLSLFGSADACEEHIIPIMKSLVDYFGTEVLFKLTIRSIIYGMGEPPASDDSGTDDLEFYLQKACEKTPDRYGYYEDRLFGIFNGAILHPDEMEGLP